MFRKKLHKCVICGKFSFVEEQMSSSSDRWFGCKKCMNINIFDFKHGKFVKAPERIEKLLRPSFRE